MIDDKAQVSIEYLVIISLMLTFATIVALIAVNFFGLRTGTIETHENFKKTMMGMLKNA